MRGSSFPFLIFLWSGVASEFRCEWELKLGARGGLSTALPDCVSLRKHTRQHAWKLIRSYRPFSPTALPKKM